MKQVLMHSAAFKKKVKNGALRIKRVPYPKYTGDEPCTQLGVDAMFPEGNSNDQRYAVKVAKSICTTCPIIADCLEFAIHHEIYGVWGGRSEAERHEIRQLRNIAVVASDYIDGYLELQDRLDKQNRE
jgi:WhiB family redox-sensing transcriptional regulator